MRVWTFVLSLSIAAALGGVWSHRKDIPERLVIGQLGAQSQPGNDPARVELGRVEHTGTINPGTDNIPVKNATLQPEGWVVRFGPTPRTRPAVHHHVVEGKLPTSASQPHAHRHLEEPGRERRLQTRPAVGEVR